MNIKDYIKSQAFKGVLVGIFIAIVSLVIFQLGVVVGGHKASFACRFGDNFERNFKDPKGKFMQRSIPGGNNIPGGHGAAGKVISIALPLMVVSSPDNLEKTVVIGSDTQVREFRNSISVDSLKVGDFVIVLGNPNKEGQVDAKLIRLAPPPPDVYSGSVRIK